MKFENLNRCAKNYFIKKEGVFIHPEYSKVA
jgi:hypothetical protein